MYQSEKKIIKKSKCCNSDIVIAKGSYLGETFDSCWNCGKLCKVIEQEITVTKRVDRKLTLLDYYPPGHFSS